MFERAQWTYSQLRQGLRYHQGGNAAPQLQDAGWQLITSQGTDDTDEQGEKIIRSSKTTGAGQHLWQRQSLSQPDAFVFLPVVL